MIRFKVRGYTAKGQYVGTSEVPDENGEYIRFSDYDAEKKLRLLTFEQLRSQFESFSGDQALILDRDKSGEYFYVDTKIAWKAWLICAIVNGVYEE